MIEPILRILDLVVNFYTDEGVVKALDGVNLNVYQGDCLGLVGETGCGKSVTMLSVLRLIDRPGRIERGKVLFKGKDLLKLSENEIREIRGKKIAMVFQDPATYLNPVLTIGYQISESVHRGHADYKGTVDERTAKEEAMKLLKQLEFPDPGIAFNKYPHELSGGMKQRVMIAMALACTPEIIILDEPTTALDATIQMQVLELLKRLREMYNATLIFITHDFGIVAEMCNKVAVMYAGTVVEYGSVKDVLEEPMHPYTRSLLNSIPKLSETHTRLEAILGEVPNLINPPPGCRFHPRCLYAKEICKRVKPKDMYVKLDHYVACHMFNADV